jgi:endogenous inhibitor of DNA gyrase (YacG/DUF329 family)
MSVERLCPTCQAPAAARATNEAWPFCSDRCRLQDLGRWFGEGYRIPGERAGDGSGALSNGGEEDAQ